MAVKVAHSKNLVTVHEEAKKWVIDPDGRLHIVGESGNVASYNAGLWAHVGFTENKAEA